MCRDETLRDTAQAEQVAAKSGPFPSLLLVVLGLFWVGLVSAHGSGRPRSNLCWPQEIQGGGNERRYDCFPGSNCRDLLQKVLI